MPSYLKIFANKKKGRIKFLLVYVMNVYAGEKYGGVGHSEF